MVLGGFLVRQMIVTVFMLVAAVETCQAQAATAVLDSLIRGHVYPLTMEDEQLGGTGADLIRVSARGAAFVALGESHNTRAIPSFTVALFRMLRDAEDFQHLALEEGPELGRRLSEAVRTRGSGGAFGIAREFPNAFHLFNEEELRMVDRIGALSAATDPIWGINQEFGLAHVYARLAELAPDHASRAVVRQLLLRSLAYEGERHARDTAFISAIAIVEDFQGLRLAFAPPEGSEAARLIEQASLSHEIYAPYREGDAAPFTAYHRSNVEREDNMKRLFSHRYAGGTAAGRPSGVLVKSGHTHLGRGRGSTGVLTLGNFLSELAIAEGARSLHLYVVLNWEDLGESWLAPFVPHLVGSENTVVDLRHIEPWAAWGRLGRLDARLAQLLNGYDMLVVLGDTSPASIEALCTPNFNWYTGIPGCR
jgi:hypothetical protein